MKRTLAAATLIAALCLMCGCARLADPLLNAEATQVPGLSMRPLAATASGTYELKAALYFRFLDEPMLATEYRTLTVRRDESAELAVINALLAGPSASSVELTRLFPEGVRALSVAEENGVLFVTLNDALLYDGVPESWLTMPEWLYEAPIKRQLTIQSLVATITESFKHRSVQIMVQPSADARQDLRLNNSYFLSELTGASEPQLRNEAYLLTPHNTALSILNACSLKDYAALYKYVAMQNADALKPDYDSFASSIAAYPALLDYTVSAGNVSLDGAEARLTADITLMVDGANASVPAYPLSLVRENSVWKITYQSLTALLGAYEGGGI